MIDEQTDSFVVRDAKGQALACIYFEDRPVDEAAVAR
jgi:hypothetical protein